MAFFAGTRLASRIRRAPADRLGDRETAIELGNLGEHYPYQSLFGLEQALL
jgi:hypothetical protein